ncbi:hypothetical protein M2444_005645 [Paenibacillus sp. PastF-3]|nr:hypothetical protein [Paenibacillus sp. PastF-3]
MEAFNIMEFSTWPFFMQILGILAAIFLVVMAVIVMRSHKLQ